MKYDIIIIGAGASGLMAMSELAGNGYSICLLEAAPKAGGRIYTPEEPGFDHAAEAGAEFIHGKLPLTLSLLKKAAVKYTAVSGRMIGIKKNGGEKNEDHDANWNKFMKKLMKTTDDLTIRQFLDKNFPAPEYASLQKSVRGFAEGFDLADINDASILFAKNEWGHENDKQFRVNGGYIKLIEYLLTRKDENTDIHFSTAVAKIVHQKNHVQVYSNKGKLFEATKIIVTASVGVLQAEHIQFEPALVDQMAAFHELGFGTVIKILLQFKTSFWMQQHPNAGFFLSEEEIPVWWTQLPFESNMLTGWLGGPRAAVKSSESETALLHTSLQSLSSIFNVSMDFLRGELAHHRIFGWKNDPFAMGGYSYDTVRSKAAKRILAKPISKTIFFAGEGVYGGDSQGTVEAALQSGKEVGKKLLKTM